MKTTSLFSPEPAKGWIPWGALAPFLLIFFVAANILCRVFNCGQPRESKFGEMWDKGNIDELIERTQRHLQDHPHDISALYFGAKALAARGLYDSARSRLRRLMLIEPALHKECQEQLDAIDEMSVGS